MAIDRNSRREILKKVLTLGPLAAVAGAFGVNGVKTASAMQTISDDLTVTGTLTVSGTGNSSVAGYLGVGKTPDQGNKLEILGAGGLLLQRNDGPSTNGPVGIDFREKTNAYASTYAGGVYSVTPDVNAESGAVVIYTNNLGISAERVRVAPDGSVGIGTTNPAAKLDVNGTTRIAGDATIIGNESVSGSLTVSGSGSSSFSGSLGIGKIPDQGNKLEILGAGGLLLQRNDGPYTNGSVGIDFREKTNAYASTYAGGVYGVTPDVNAESGAVVIYTNNLGVSAERLRVAPDGSVGIGTTSPAAKLDVNGNVRVAGNVVLAGGTLQGTASAAYYSS